MTTPVVDLAHLHGQLATEIEEAALRVLRSGHYLRGPETAGLEQEFGAACGAPFAIGVNSGFDALRLALLGLGIGPGDEVVVPSHTAIATWLAVTQTGARVVPVDPREDTMLVDVDAVRAAIGPRTAAVVVVHLYGHVVDIEPLVRLARDRGLAVVEDCAQAHGARDRGADRTVGTAGDAGAFSFYPTKNLGGAGDGGMVVTRDEALAERVRMLANYGERERLFSETLGWNSRLDEIQAAMLRVKLRALPRWNQARRDRADGYLAALADEPRMELSPPRAGTTPVWHQFVVRVDERDAVRARLADRGVQALVHYPQPPHRSAAYADQGPWTLPVADRLARRVLSLPAGPHVDDATADRVASALLDAVRH